MPDSVIKIINNWGKSQKNADFKNKLEFWDRLKQKYSWENDDLDVDDGKVEEELVSKFTHIPAEIPGVRMAAHVQPDTGAIQAPPVPSMSYIAAAARANAGLAPTTGVSQPAGVVPTNVVDLTDAADNDNKSPTLHIPKEELEDVPMEDDIEDTAQADVESPPAVYGCGMRIRNKPVSYEPVMTGKTYRTQKGINNLCYRGNRYTLSEVLPSGPVPYQMGVINLNMDTLVQIETPDEGWQDDDSLTEHLLGVILVQQYNLKKELELFGDRAEVATTKELQQIHNVGTYVPQ